MNKFTVIATVNTHLLNSKSLNEFIDNGATILRINGSHVDPSEIEFYARKIRSSVGNKIKVLVDLPGNKIRTAKLAQPIRLSMGSSFVLRAEQFNYPGFIRFLSPGDELLANDSLFKFKVESVADDHVTLHSFSDGLLLSNKGIHLSGKETSLPFLFDRDRQLIKNSIAYGLDYIGLSFVRTAEDVKEAKECIKGSQLGMIVKVETAPAIRNLGAILDEAEEFLVDRGDLSCDVGIENIDRYQKLVLTEVKKKNKTIYFATQFLHSMVHNNVPLIAEVCGLADAIGNGVDGVQLSEETAIGKYPIEVLQTVQKVLTVTCKKRGRIFSNHGTPALWFTGRSGSGKSTLCKKLVAELQLAGLKVCLIDGDEFRGFWKDDLGYTKEDRIKNLRNIIFTAYQGTKSFDVVVVASLSPYADIRTLARERLENFHEIYVECSNETCMKRDPKGLYAKAKRGDLANFIGVADEYEVPTKPELKLDTEKLSIDQAMSTLLKYIQD